MEYLNSLSSNVIEISIRNKNLIILPDLSRFTCLQKLDCSINQLTQLDNLPSSLKTLSCSFNHLTQLDNLSSSLLVLYCDNNQLTHLDNLPLFLNTLNCSNN